MSFIFPATNCLMILIFECVCFIGSNVYFENFQTNFQFLKGFVHNKFSKAKPPLTIYSFDLLTSLNNPAAFSWTT